MKKYYDMTFAKLQDNLKWTLFSLVLVFMSFKGFSQVNSYTFSETLSAYTPLVGGTVAYSAPWDNHTTGAATQVTLPFTFNFDYNPYTQFYISPNGFITFGNALQPTPINYAPISNTALYSGAISAFGIDLNSNGSDITYGIEGTAPNRTMVIQWANVVRKGDAGDFNFQIRLNENNSTIDLSYGLCTPIGNILRPVQVGLRGETSVFAQGDVLNRIQGSDVTWHSQTQNGVANNSTVRTRNVSPTVQSYPDLGLKYSYVPAPLCVTPPVQPTGLIIGGTSITHNSFVGNTFTAPTPAPTNYLILRSTTNVAPTPAEIVNGVYYANATAVPLSAFTAVVNTNTTTFNQTGLTPETTYYYWIVPYNNLCGGAPTYNLSGLLTGNQSTCSPPTTATAATSLTGNGFVANWTDVPTATGYELDVSTNATFTAMVPGYSALSVGLVNNFTVTGLLPLVSYYYRVRAIGVSCPVNSNTITVVNPCGYYTIPYTQNFDSFGIGVVPTCYTRDDVNADAIQWQTQNISFSSASRSMHIAKSTTAAMDDWFFMPGLSLNGGTSYRLFFRYNTGNTSSVFENLRVRLGSGASITSMTETLMDLPNINNSSFQIAIVDFTPVTNGIYYIGFQGYSIANQSFIAIDDISVTVSPTCFQPTEVVVNSTGVTTASISWTASNPAPSGGYQYYVSTSSTPPTAGTTPSGSVGAGITTANITALTSSTTYYVWVRGNCGPTDKSVWSLEESFSTDCNTPAVVSTTSGVRCGYGTVAISATPNATSTINWYTVNSGGSVIATGNNFTTPAIGATTTYYAEAKAFGPIAKVGPSSPSTQGGIIATQTASAVINFNVTDNTTFQSLDIFPMVSGQTGQIILRNSSNITIASYPFTTSVSGGLTPQVITLNRVLPAGNYNLFFSTVPVSGVRYNTTNGFYPYLSSIANILGNTTDNTFYIGLYNWKFTTECLSPRVAVTATVTTPPALTISSASSTICETNSTPLVTIGGYSAYNTLVWSPNTNISGSFATGFTFNPTTTTTYTLLANQTTGALCGNSITYTVNVEPAPSPIIMIPASASICENTIQSLSGAASVSAPIPVFTETFNSATNSWAVANTSVGGDVVASQWTLRPNNYNYINGFGWNVTFHSNDNSQFCMANSDAQSASAGIVTRTTLTSPTFSLAGYTGASLSLWHFLRYTAFDTVLVEISTNGGASWGTIKQYTSSQGIQGTAQANFVNDNINLNPYVGNTNLKIRFNYTSPWGYLWAIDNVVVSGTLATALTWTPITNLYSDAAATVPYVAGTALNAVYARPTATTTYTATLSGANGCFRTNTVTLTVTPASNGGVLSGNQDLCTAAAPTNLSLTGSVGTILRWEYANDAAFTAGVTTIANTTATLTPAQMGVITTIRYFRAVVRNGICNQAYSNVVYVAYPTSTWNGTAWSNGVPTSSTLAVFNGNYSSTGDLNACAVRVNSGTVTINSGHTFTVQNDVLNLGGTLVFENNASLLQINSVSNSGNIQFKRNTTPIRRYDFTYWSTPVSPQTLTALSPATLYDKYFKFDPVFGNWVNVPSNSLMDIGKGYIVRAPQFYDIVATTIYNATFVGIPNNGTYTTPIYLSTSDLNLIGNPYPSALNIDSFMSDPSNVGVVDGTIYLWTHNSSVAANQYAMNDYAIYNYMGGVGTSSAINSGVNSSVPNGKIASGQSFFIRGLSTGNATFRNTMRVSGNNDQFFRMSSRPVTAASVQDLEKNRIWLDLIGNESYYKQILIGYCETATDGIDRGFDSKMLEIGNTVNLYSLNDEHRLSIQGKALPFTVNDQVPLGFVSTVDGSFTVKLAAFDGLFENQDVYLLDNYLNVIHNLKQSDYNFVSNAGTFENRFVIVYENSTLSNPETVFNESSITVYKPYDKLMVNSGSVIMKNIKVYDMRGRLIQEIRNINDSEAAVDVGTTNQALLLQITSDDDRVVTKKYIN